MEVDAPQGFDLEAYASSYFGHAKIFRLMHIASISAGQSLELEALKLAADELKKTLNTAKYQEVMGKIDSRAGPEYTYDSNWAEETDAAFHHRHEALEAELASARSNLVKGGIRTSHLAIGDLMYQRGDVPEAFRQYLRIRDYCTSSQHIVEMCIKVVRCAVELGQNMHVGTYAQKVEALPPAEIDVDALSAMRASHGVAHLAQGKFKLAALALTSLPSKVDPALCATVSPGDVATYGTLCVLATMDRADVATKVVEPAIFREMLGAAPQEVRDAVQHIHASRYGEALAALGRLRPVLALDPFLGAHVEGLYKAIRARAMAQYTRPFASLDLQAMAATFDTDVDSMERELAALIASNDVTGRIDASASALLCTKEDARAATYRAALDAAQQYLRGTRALLVRAAMMRHDLIQRQAPGDRDRPERPERGEGPRGPGGAYPRGGDGPGGHGRRPGRPGDRVMRERRNGGGGGSGRMDTLPALGAMQADAGGSSGSMQAD